MNKSNLVDSIIKNTDLTKTKAGLVVDAVMSAIIGALKSGHSVTLIGFGSFSAVKRAARMGRNPKTGKEIKIPSKTVAKFKAGKALKEAVSGIKSKTKKVNLSKFSVNKKSEKLLHHSKTSLKNRFLLTSK